MMLIHSPSLEVIGFVKQDRSGRIRWLLDELEIPYSSRFLDIKKGENESPEYLRLSPLGLVPTLLENGHPINESGAICLYLADRYGKRKAIAPDATSSLRSEFLHWYFFAAATLDPKTNELGLAERAPVGDPLHARVATITSELREICAVIENRIRDRDYLVGNEFSLADIIAGNCLSWLLDGELPQAEFPRIHSYVERLKARPAVKTSGAIQ